MVNKAKMAKKEKWSIAKFKFFRSEKAKKKINNRERSRIRRPRPSHKPKTVYSPDPQKRCNVQLCLLKILYCIYR